MAGEKWYCEEDGAPGHVATDTREIFAEVKANLACDGARSRPPDSPDLDPRRYILWREMRCGLAKVAPKPEHSQELRPALKKSLGQYPARNDSIRTHAVWEEVASAFLTRRRAIRVQNATSISLER